MLKIIGGCLVLVVAFILGIQMKYKVAEHLEHLISLKEILLMLSAEMSYARTPLAEAFVHIAERGKEPYAQLLKEVAERMKGERNQTLYEIWTSAIDNHRNKFVFSEEEMGVLKGVGENFGYLDMEMQLKNLNLYVQQIENRIQQSQQELAVKQKMYQYLSVMSGLFLILLLI